MQNIYNKQATMFAQRRKYIMAGRWNHDLIRVTLVITNHFTVQDS